MFSSFNFLGRTIHLYGVFCTIGIVVAVCVALVLAKRKGFEFFDFVLVAIITLLSAFVGAKLMFLIVSWKTIVLVFQSYPFWEALLSVFQGGFVFYGGLIGGAIGLFVTLKIKKANFFDYANIYALVLPLGHAFGRIGCFFAGCCYGIEYAGIFSFTYITALDASTPLGVPLLAIQLIEAVALFELFGILLLNYILFPKYRNLVSYIYVFAYSILRFTLESFRGDLERGLLFNLSTSQWISILIFVCMSIYLVCSCVKKKKKVIS